MSTYPNPSVVVVYAFHECLAAWRALSTHGGDEDYVIVGDRDAGPVDQVVNALTVCDAEEVTLPDGRTAFITAHS